jgi:hypothetical protein
MSILFKIFIAAMLLFGAITLIAAIIEVIKSIKENKEA